MKPKEFDDLVRQKFDQNDFAYNPRHWDELAERMDGKTKKRNIMVWWWAPVVGMAASVALAFGVSTLLRMGTPATTGRGLADAHNTNNKKQHSAQIAAVPYTPGAIETVPGATKIEKGNQDAYTNPAKASGRHHRNTTDTRNRTALNSRVHNTINDDNGDDGFNINMKHAAGNAFVWNAKPSQLTKKTTEDEVKKNKVAVNEPVVTFIGDEPQEQPKKLRRVSLILSGGYNRGNQNTGYMAGATIRKMITEKVYVEGDVAFASSNNTQSTTYAEVQNVPAMKNSVSTARTTKDLNKSSATNNMVEVIKQKDVSYDLYYAQVTPSIGYNVMSRMSIAVGPDFQKMLVDNRPAPSTVERGTIQVAPLFDVGFIGKTEVGVTKKLKAAVYYRKGVNNVITPMGKYIDRDYLQFQLKYTILNK